MKIPKQAYTTEFKELAVKRVRDGQSISTVIKELGLGDQTLRNWVKASAEGKLKGAGGKVVTPEEMELSRLRVENLRLKRENEILKKATVYFARDLLWSTPGLPNKACATHSWTCVRCSMSALAVIVHGSEAVYQIANA